MSINIRKLLNALGLVPKAVSTIDSQGEMEVLTSDGALHYHNGTSSSPVTTAAHTQTLTNKSIDADSNTITNIDNNDIKAAAGIVDTKLATISTTGKVSNSATTATDANTASAIVARDASGNFSAGTITAALSGNATTATTATNFSGSLAGDVSGTQGATVVDTVGGKTDTEIATSVTDTQAATSSNTVSTIVKRDASGNFSAGTITAALSGNATTATTATNVSGTVAIANGGTGQTSQTAAFDALAPTTTAGDLITHNGTDNIRLPVGSSGQVLKVVGGAPSWSTFSGGINYLSGNPDAESDTSGWATYADAAGTQPVDGTGGSPTVTWTRTTSSPLRGSASFLFTKDAANRQGEGASYDFTIDSTDQAKVLTVSFDYAVASGTYATGDLTVYLYDVTNALVIQPTGYQIESASTGLGMKHVATFQTASNSTSYRLILHVASTSASAYTVKCDNFAVSPQVITQGTPVTDWTSYTPTFAGLGTVTGIDFKWRRVGDSIQIKGAATTGTPTATTASFTLPNSYSNNLATTFKVGTYGRVNANAEQHAMITQAADKTKLYFSIQTGSVADLFTANGNTLFAPSEYFTVDITDMPILGWSSQVQMSSDTDTRVVAAAYQASSGQTFTSGSTTKVTFATKLFDTHSVFATDTYTVPVSGKYRVSTNFRVTPTSYSAAGNQVNISLYKNGSGYADLDLFQPGSTTTSDRFLSGSQIIDCVAGDTLDLRLFQNTGANVTGGNTTQGQVSFERISGPSQIAQSESVNAKYNTSAAQSIANTGEPIVDFGTKVYDSHGAVTTGASWKFTAPISGKYSVRAACHFTNANWGASTLQSLRVYKNGSADDYIYWQEIQAALTSRQTTLRGGTTIQLNAGEYIDVRISQNDSGSRSLLNSSNDNYIVIERVGNY